MTKAITEFTEETKNVVMATKYRCSRCEAVFDESWVASDHFTKHVVVSNVEAAGHWWFWIKNENDLRDLSEINGATFCWCGEGWYTLQFSNDKWGDGRADFFSLQHMVDSLNRQIEAANSSVATLLGLPQTAVVG